MTLTSISVKDAAASTVTMAVKDTGSSVYAAAHHPVIGTTEVAATNPMPVALRPAVAVAPTMGTQTSGAYSSADFVDGKLTLSSAVPTSAGSGVIQQVTVTSKAVQTTGSFDVIFFSADPSGTTVTDNAVADIADADLPKVIGVAHCADLTALSGSAIWQCAAAGLSFKLASGTTIYAALVARFAISTASTSDIALNVVIAPDV